MKAIRPVDLRRRQKEFLDMAHNGEILIVVRPAQKNVVIMSEAEFDKREKALRNAEYLATLNNSIKEAERGEVVTYTKEQMDAMLEKTDPFFSKANQARLALSRKQVAEGKIIYKTSQELGLDDE